jgi:LCP family protein required for cell wall assembly
MMKITALAPCSAGKMATTRKILYAILLIGVLLAACQSLSPVPAVAPAAVGLSPNLLTIPADATATATPFQPVAPTPTYLPTATPTQPPPPPPKEKKNGGNNFAGPSEYSYLPVPPPVGRLPQPDGQINILILGSDQRPGWVSFRTDTILLLTINPDDRSIHLTSFPRDLYIYIPGWTMERINTAYYHGGFEAIANALEYNLGVYPDHYVLINFNAFVEIVDSLGGIDVNAETGLSEWVGNGIKSVPAGLNHMNGKTALWYARSRYSTNDFDRNRRQQEVLQGIFDRLMSLYTISKAPEMFEIYTRNVSTDMNFTDLIPLLPFAAKVTDLSDVKHFFIGSAQVSGWMTPAGASVLLPNREAVVAIMRKALNSP